MQPNPIPRIFTQKGILKFVCKVGGLIFILQSLFSIQRIVSVGTAINSWSEGNLALGIDLVSNAVISWFLFTKSDWIAEKLDVSSDEIRVSIGKQELLEIVVIVVGFVLVISSASNIFDSVVRYVYLSAGGNQGVRLPTDEIFFSSFVLAGGLLILKHHKRVLNWVSNLRESDHSE